MIVWLCGFAAITLICWGVAFSAVQRSRIKAEASVARSHERHLLFDFSGKIRP